MIQARRTNRKTNTSNTSKEQLIGHGLREIVLIFFCFMALYLFVSLVTYYPGDPGWSHSGPVEEVRNKGGVAGALFADLFFLWFGYFAYLFPIMVGYVGWLIYQGKHHDILAHPRSLFIPGIGFILTLVAGCGLAIVHFSTESVLLPSHAGGLLGTWVGHWLVGKVNPLGATLIFMAMFFTGITLLTGLSWLWLMDTLGYHTLQWLPVVKKYASRHLFPWLLRHLKHGLQFAKGLLKLLFTKLRQWGAAIYARWQARRAAWRREREQYDDYDYDYEENEENEKEDFFRKDQNKDQNFVAIADPEPQLLKQKVTVSPPPLPLEPQVAEVVVNPTTSLSTLLPELSLFNPVPHPPVLPSVEDLAQWLTDGLLALQVEAEVNAVHPGPVLTGFEVQTITPINANHLEELSQALAKVLEIDKVWTVEIHAGLLSIEIPNRERQAIYLSDLLASQEYQHNSSPLPIALGRDLNGQPVIIDLTRIPHILMAGSVAEEKTIAINTLLLSLLFKATPTTLRLLLVDDTTHQLSVYANLPHLLIPVVNTMEEIPRALKWCTEEMERRYRVMANLEMRNLESYNQALLLSGQAAGEDSDKKAKQLPYIVVIINEIADILKNAMETTVEEYLTRLTQKARAAGIHLILATQYPSVNVITGLIKANISTRMAFQVTNKTESRTILGQMGAENLLGQGDMLYMTAGTGVPVRVHGSLVTDREVQRIVTDLKARATPDYVLLKMDEHEI
jgi:S-DNA-T family DNA segregation ATPase FtsK/SpoIIIE